MPNTGLLSLIVTGLNQFKRDPLRGALFILERDSYAHFHHGYWHGLHAPSA